LVVSYFKSFSFFLNAEKICIIRKKAAPRKKMQLKNKKYASFETMLHCLF